MADKPKLNMNELLHDLEEIAFRVDGWGLEVHISDEDEQTYPVREAELKQLPSGKWVVLLDGHA